MSYYVYFIQEENDGPIKIGVSWNVTKRLHTLQSANPHELFVLDTVRCASKTAAAALEKKLHRRLHAYQIRGEWFEPVPEVRVAIHDPEGDYTKTRQEESHTPHPDLDNPDSPPWADDIDRNNLMTLPLKHRRRIVATSIDQYGAAVSR